MILHAAVYDHVRLQRNPFLGEVRLHLDTVNFEDATALEYGLCDKVKPLAVVSALKGNTTVRCVHCLCS